ncbi:bifunctional heparan sulfate N-deacetylase/N-sulfotransferase 4 isoform X2 [Hydra vulgaris]|uniref:bifunctional heparan sulfate N-deacetylase/N-sulfotransferase 4 isoform X2 n=1 Tax=Hydra vulgaris TaxID=6087 RepID=UPI001F5FB8D0|nr:bifunctional heparan sulfate N-deacetylase/N-sulfotransferase 4 isoform X2 [Hydra vulgaris]
MWLKIILQYNLIRFLCPKTRKRFVFILFTFLLLLFACNMFVRNQLFIKETQPAFVEKKVSTMEFLDNSLLMKSKKIMPVMHQYQEDLVSEIIPSVLIFTADHNNKDKALTKKLKFILNSLKISFYFVLWNRPEDDFLTLPRLQDKFGNAAYHTFIFTNHLLYDELDSWTRNIINEHCKLFKVGIIILVEAIKANNNGISEFYQLRSIPVSIKSGVMDLYDFEIAKSSVYKIVKTGNILKGWTNRNHNSILLTDDPSFEPMAFWKMSINSQREFSDKFQNSSTIHKVVSILFDKGYNDGISKVLFGASFDTTWLHQLVFVDSLMTLSNGVLGFGIERFIQIDIDDIFVGTTGKKLVKSDIEDHHITVDPSYSVAPHHSGVYPVHRPLYHAWKEVWGIEVTSTESYPTLYPAWNRAGFIYDGIMVLPRQTCGLFTKTLNNADYPKGPNWLSESAHGGELFWSIVFNPIAIFMTHACNYGFKERLAIHLFKNVTSFIEKWTNIKLLSDKPVELGKRYFGLFPRHAEPLWTDPCVDLRHQKIWAGTEKYCKGEGSRISRLPDFLIIGPQKTGTTALYKFLSLQEDVLKHNRLSNNSFEEIQFFNRNNYAEGLDWYLEFFPDEEKLPGVLYFEKSANYFDSLKSPQRAHSLIPNAKLIVILTDPRVRAHSWYQHMLSKKDAITQNFTFYEVVTGIINKDSEINETLFSLLRGKCLIPGRYAESLELWLKYYSSNQIYVMDGMKLRHKPHVAMKELINFLNISDFPYERLIKWSTQKRFYCPINSSGILDCLGKGKGRIYSDMSEDAFQFLTDYYKLPNLRLIELLKKHGKPLPSFLIEDNSLT